MSSCSSVVMGLAVAPGSACDGGEALPAIGSSGARIPRALRCLSSGYVIEFVRAHRKEYDAEFAITFEGLVAELDPPPAS